MKKPFLYIGSVLIFILAAVAFVFVPARVGNSAGIGATVFGKYDGKPIELKPGTEFANAVNNYQNSFQQQGRSLSDSDYFYIYSYAFNAAVQTIAAKAAVAQSGYRPSEMEVSRQLLKLPYFLDENGKYSEKVASLYSNEQKEELRKSVSEQLVQSRFNEDLFGSGAQVGGKSLFGLKGADEESEFIAKIGERKRSFDVISFDKSKYPDSEVRKFAEENMSLFERFDLSAISFADEATAKKVKNQIEKDEIKFEDAVKEEYSEKYYTDNDGKITASHLYQIKGILADENSVDSLRSLAKGSLSEIVRTTDGFTLFRKDGDNAQPDFSDADTLDVAKKYVTANESGRIEEYFIQAAKNASAMALADGFEELDLASVDGAEKMTTSPFPLNYGNATVAATIPTEAKPLASGASSEKFWETAFSLKAGAFSEPLVLGNYVVALKLHSEETEKADQSKLDAIRGDIQSYDQNAAYTALIDGDKVENNVWNAYANLHMRN